MDLVGDTDYFGTVGYSPEAIANLLSWDTVAGMYEIEWNPEERTFSVHVDDNTVFKFHNREGLHVCSMTPVEAVLVTTVADNIAKYTSRQVADAEKAKDLIRRLGYPSTQALIRLMKTGGLLDCEVTIHDVYRAHKIWGTDIATLKGKTKHTKNSPVRVEYIPRPLEYDLMFVEGTAYLISVSTPL